MSTVRPLALVTGASSGIGEAFARDLAARGHDLVLAARRAGRLETLASAMRAAHGVRATVVSCDLATPDGLARCRAAVDAQGRALDVAVLNAGFGRSGPLVAADREDQSRMVRVNVEAVVDLACHVLPGMRARGSGALVIVSSAAAWQPLPYMAVYAATKAFELSLAEALRAELRRSGVRVVAVCPGWTATEFQAIAGSNGLPSWVPQERAEGVVAATWRALARGRPHVATGPLARLAIACARLLPRALVVWGAALVAPAGRRVRR